MKMRRIVTAESESGVVVQTSDLLESTSAELTTNIWGSTSFRTCPSQPSRRSATTSRWASSVRKAPSASTSNHCFRRRATRRRIWDRLLPSSTSGRATTSRPANRAGGCTAPTASTSRS